MRFTELARAGVVTVRH